MSEFPLRYFGSAVILVRGEAQMLQRKTVGYPVDPYVGCTTLIGGFWSRPEDASPRETLERELREELRPLEVAERVIERLTFFGGYDYWLPRLDDEQGAFWTRSYVFEARLPESGTFDDWTLTEGEALVAPSIADYEGEMCWGHDATLAAWGERNGADVELEGATAGFEPAALEEPESYRDVDRKRLVHDPLRKGGAGRDSLGVADD